MSVLHMWALGLGVAAATLPVIIHRLTRPKPITLPTSTLRFIQGAVRERRASHRLRDLVVLALRTAAVALLALAFARPFLGESDASTGAESATRVVLLDVSQSLAAGERGI